MLTSLQQRNSPKRSHHLLEDDEGITATSGTERRARSRAPAPSSRLMQFAVAAVGAPPEAQGGQERQQRSRRSHPLSGACGLLLSMHPSAYSYQWEPLAPLLRRMQLPLPTPATDALVRMALQLTRGAIGGASSSGGGGSGTSALNGFAVKGVVVLWPAARRHPGGPLWWRGTRCTSAAPVWGWVGLAACTRRSRSPGQASQVTGAWRPLASVVGPACACSACMPCMHRAPF